MLELVFTSNKKKINNNNYYHIQLFYACYQLQHGFESWTTSMHYFTSLNCTATLLSISFMDIFVPTQIVCAKLVQSSFEKFFLSDGHDMNNNSYKVLLGEVIL